MLLAYSRAHKANRSNVNIAVLPHRESEAIQRLGYRDRRERDQQREDTRVGCLLACMCCR